METVLQNLIPPDKKVNTMRRGSMTIIERLHRRQRLRQRREEQKGSTCKTTRNVVEKKKGRFERKATL
jgi:hypothetical protein